jgi:hypothetical protein
VANGNREGWISLAGLAGRQRDPRMTLDPIHQFNINNFFPIGHSAIVTCFVS